MQQHTIAPRGWQFASGPTDDFPPSHLTKNGVLKLARDAGAMPFDLGNRIHIRRGSFARDFEPTAEGLFRAAPIRSWLGV